MISKKRGAAHPEDGPEVDRLVVEVRVGVGEGDHVGLVRDVGGRVHAVPAEAKADGEPGRVVCDRGEQVLDRLGRRVGVIADCVHKGSAICISG